MTGTHGDLFREIGALVVAAHDGQSFDLKQTAEELARCYVNLGVPADTIARALARSMAAVGVSMAMMRRADQPILHRQTGTAADPTHPGSTDPGGQGASIDEGASRSASMLFPSGIKVAVLS